MDQDIRNEKVSHTQIQKCPTSQEIKEAFQVGVLGGLVGQYAGNITSNILEKEQLDLIFVPKIGPAYYANVVAGGVGAILALYINNTDLFITAAVILNQVLINLFLQMENEPGYNGDELIYNIIRNTFVLIIILRALGLVDGETPEEIIVQEEDRFNKLLQDAIILGVVVNSTISLLNHYGSLDDMRTSCFR